LPKSHPLIALFCRPDSLSVLADLDDTVIYGSLAMLRQSTDPLVSEFSGRLQTRQLFKAIDLHSSIDPSLPRAEGGDGENLYRRRRENIEKQIEEWLDDDPKRRGRILLDAAERRPYKPIEEEGPMNQIWIREGSNLLDLRKRSPAVAAIDTYRAFWAYVAEDDEEARRFVATCVSEAIQEIRS
jgi:hypothetical protein